MRLNKVIKILITSDLFLNLGWGLLSPIFAIFILKEITDGDALKAAQVAGFSALFYWITKAIFEIPIGYALDKKDGEKDDFLFMILGMIITAVVPIGFLFSNQPWHIYFWQVLHAIGMAMAFPSWLAIFTRHIDKGKEALEWSIETAGIGLGAGIAGGLGGIAVGFFGFKVVFIVVSLLTFLSVLLLLLVGSSMKPRVKDGEAVPSGRSLVEP